MVFDLKTLARVAEIRSTGEGPDAIYYDAATQRVFAFNGRSHDVTAIDAARGTVAGTIALAGKPESVAGDAEGRLYVNLEDRGSIAALDARSLAVTAVWPVAGCENPTGLALDARRQRLFAACGNRVMTVLDAGSGRVLGSAPIGAGVDFAAYDPSARLAFASCGEGVLTAVTVTTAGSAQVAQAYRRGPARAPWRSMSARTASFSSLRISGRRPRRLPSNHTRARRRCRAPSGCWWRALRPRHDPSSRGETSMSKCLRPSITAAVLAALLPCALLASRAAPAADSADDKAANTLAHDIFKQLIEINTTDSVGNVTTAAEAMAQRFRDAGFPDSDMQSLRPERPQEESRRRACTAAASTSRSCSSATSTWSRRSARTGPPIRSSSSRRTATSTAAARRT